jgi:soluble lytic murein transglycosylase-like protein
MEIPIVGTIALAFQLTLIVMALVVCSQKEKPLAIILLGVAAIMGIVANKTLYFTPTNLPKIPTAKIHEEYQNKIAVVNEFTTNPEITSAIINASMMYNVDVKLICAVISVESNWDSLATSPVGAIGLMQIMPQTVLLLSQIKYLPKVISTNDLYNPRINIMLGTAILSYELGKFDVPAAIAAYNGGHKCGKLYANNQIHLLPEETRQYVPKVMFLL